MALIHRWPLLKFAIRGLLWVRNFAVTWMIFASSVSEPGNFFAGGLESRAVPRKRLGLT